MDACDAPIIEDRVVRSSVPHQPVPDADYATYLRSVWGKFKDRTALVHSNTGERYTYGELEDACNRVAAGLASLGFGPGDMAGIHCETGLDAMVAFYGTAFAGGSMVFAKASLTAREVKYDFEETKPCIVFCDEENATKAQEACKTIPSVKTLVVFGQREGMVPFSTIRRSPRAASLPRVDPESLLAVLFSSGTTGLPKAAILSHRNAVAHLFCASPDNTQVVDIDDVLLGTAPFTHVSGLLFNHAVFASGACLVIVGSSEPCDVLPAIEKYKATVMFQFPTILQKLVRSPLLERYDVSSVKKVYVGGSATPSVTVEETLQKFNLDHFGQVYSMSESFGSGMISHKGKDYETVGPPTAMTKVKVVDVNTGEKLGPKETGEIRMKSPTCVSGYMNNSEATANLYDEDGFMRTGDIGYYNESGEFYVMDRIKDMFKCMDRQVAPSEIEEVLTQHEAVKEAAVAGVPHSEFGEAPRAFVVLNAGYAPSEATAAELRALVSANTAPQKHLHGGVEFVSTIPKSDTGKNLRKDLRNAYLQRQAARGL
ncbi:luciferin 4-monooxygenase-like isoform X1 [Dermacentor variabilis]|uniref:luciferin 4-monooxygenase-like isoform X1 n=2 Tax=Dermacentor variabilis TaxID=34621 RepID=UPI003F5AE230